MWAPKRKKKEAKQPAPTGPKKPLKQRIGIAPFITSLVLLAIIGGTSVLGYYAVHILVTSKTEDAWVIAYLQAERFGTSLVDVLQSTARRSRETKPSATYDVAADGKLKKLSGDMPNDLSLSDLGMKSPQLPAKYSVLEYAGEIYGATLTQSDDIGQSHATLSLWRLPDLNGWLTSTLASTTEESNIFLVNRQGRLVYSSTPEITTVTFGSRAITRQFVKNPIKHGQWRLKQGGQEVLGFFYEVPETNLVLFMETSWDVINAPILALEGRFIAVAFGLTVFLLVALQSPLRSITWPLRELTRLSAAVARGNFDVTPINDGVGEIASLANHFGKMTLSLQERERTIEQLLGEQEKKAHLAQELATASAIQMRLLPSEILPPAANLKVNAYYQPAAETAGDWYNHFYHAPSGESVIAIADVSGHGTGAALFTAVIAGLFEDYASACTLEKNILPIEELATSINRVCRKLGRGEWHASFQAISYRATDRRLQILNAGHVFPVIIAANKGKSATSINMPSDVLGLDQSPKFSVKSVQLASGDSVFLYTDGLTEGRDAGGKMFGKKKLVTLCGNMSDLDPDALVNYIRGAWQTHLENTPAKDDICIIAARAN